MRQVLRRLGFLNEQGIVTQKGQVACEISSADELVATTLLYEGVFKSLSPEQIAALFSCFAFQEKSSQAQQKLPDSLSVPYKMLLETIKKIVEISNEADLGVDGMAYRQKFQPQLMSVVFQWCKGASFLEITKMTNVLEGSVVRAMRRLEEMLGELESATRVIGDKALEQKFKKARELMKRDIVFTASLYLQ